MTDARLPERWLNDYRFDDLTDAAYRLYFTALLSAVSNRTDGLLEDRRLKRLPNVDPGCAGELEKAGLWERQGDRWLILDFANTQTSSAQLEGLDKRRRQDRDRSKRYRDNKKASRDSSRDDIGQDRLGQARTGTEGEHEDEPWPDIQSPGSGIPYTAGDPS